MTLLKDSSGNTAYYTVPEDQIIETLKLDAFESIERGLDKARSQETAGTWLVTVAMSIYFCLVFLVLFGPIGSLLYALLILAVHAVKVLYTAYRAYRSSRRRISFHLSADQSSKLEHIQPHLIIDTDHQIWKTLLRALRLEVEELGQPGYMAKVALEHLLEPNQENEIIKLKVDNYIIECLSHSQTPSVWTEAANDLAMQIAEVVAHEIEEITKTLDETSATGDGVGFK